MEIPTLQVDSRKPAGSRAAARLRREGKLPAILYGHERPPVPIALDYHDIEQHLEHGVRIVQLDMGGQVQPCQFKDAQYDYLGTGLVHLDLVRVALTERIKVSVPIEFRGTPEGAGEGGVFRHELTDLEIECVVAEIPESIRVDISGLKLDDVLHVKDLGLHEGFIALVDAETVVGMVRLPMVSAPETESVLEGGEAKADADAEPEVIAKGKPEEEGGKEKKS